MAESNATQVILTDDGIKIIKAQNTADNAASQAENANSAVSIAQSTANAARSAADSTYAYADSEIAVQSTATAKAQSTADNAFSQAQAVGSQVSAEISSNSTATAKAQSTADNAFSQATTAIDTGNVASQAVTALKDGSTMTIAQLQNGLATKVANSEYASYKDQTASQIGQMVTNGAFSAYQQTTADLISSKVANSDFSAYQATTAKAIESKVESKDFNTYKTQTADLIDDKVSSSAYASDKTQTASQIANMVSNSAFSTYQNQTASQIGQMVTNGAFSAYQQTTADLISSKVANSDFSAYQATTAKAIESKVESSDFNTYKTQTADAISSKVSSTDFNNLKISNRNLALGTATAFKMTGNGGENNASLMYSTSHTIPNGTTITASFDITSTSSSGSYLFQFINSTWQSFTGSPLVSGTQHFSSTFTTTGDFSDGIQLRLDNSTSTVTVSNFIISESSKEVSWTPAPEDQATQSQITQLSGEIEQKVSNSDYASYKDQTASQIGEMVTNGAFSAYKQTTADLISSKVANSDFSAYQATTAKAIESKVESKDFNTYKTQTADSISSKVESSDFQALQTQVDNSSVGTNLYTDTRDFDNSSVWDNWGNWQKTGEKFNGLSVMSTTGDWSGLGQTIQAKKGEIYTFSIYARYESGTGNSTMYFLPWDVVNSTTDITFATFSLNETWQRITATIKIIADGPIITRLERTNNNSNTLLIAGPKLEKGSHATDYSVNPEDTATQSQITQLSGDINLRVKEGDLIDQINIKAGNTLISSSGQLTLSGKTIYFDTDNPVIIPSANITGTLNGKTITGSVINGTTFNAGTQLNSYGNTSYPLTINQDGSVTSTSFETIANETAALRTVIKDGTVKTNLRGMTQFATGMYSAADVSLGAGQLALYEGYSTSQDPNFNATGLTKTGYVILDASTGLSLHGVTQAINFSGTDQDQTTGIQMNSYGNIIGYPNSNWWRIVDFSGNQLANFGIDRAGSNTIQFNRELDVGNFQINTGHTVTSADKGDIHFAKGGGGAANIYAGDVHYTSLVKSSLLSVKKDVKKADTAYWAQLVNSIDLATYQYKSDDNMSHLRLSSIVDDVNNTKQWQLPDVFISRDENGKVNGVDDSVLLNATLATVQEQQKEIDKLNGHNMELEARLNKLEVKLNG